MSLNLSTSPPDVGEQGLPDIYIFAAIVLGIIGFFGFILNLLVILTIVKEANVLWTPNNVILANMVVSIIAISLYRIWVANNDQRVEINFSTFKMQL